MLIYNNTEQRLFENNRTGRKWNTHNYIAGAHVCARRRVWFIRQMHRSYRASPVCWVQKTLGLYLLLLPTVLWIHHKRGRKISSNREIPKMACRAMTESIKITAFFRPTSGNLFLPSSFHLLLKRPADGGFGCERTSFHPPFSLLSSVKLLLARQRLKADCEGTWEARMKGGWGEVLSFLTDWLSACSN